MSARACRSPLLRAAPQIVSFAAFVPTATTTSSVPTRRRHRRRRRAIRVYSVILLSTILLAVAFAWVLRHLG
jgi:hypothetical protein